MRIIARFSKGDSVRFVSHLDIQRLFQRALRRAGIQAAYSNGFNPHPLLSFATALSVGYTSEAEWLDIKLESDMDTDAFIEKLNAALPCGFAVLEANEFPEKAKTLTALMESALYEVSVDCDADKMRSALDSLLSKSEIIVNKRTKAGMRDVDMKPQLISAEASDGDGGTKLILSGKLNAAGSLSVELLMGSLFIEYGEALSYSVHRKEIVFSEQSCGDAVSCKEEAPDEDF